MRSPLYVGVQGLVRRIRLHEDVQSHFLTSPLYESVQGLRSAQKNVRLLPFFWPHFAPVVQWIEPRTSKPLMLVRFQPGARACGGIGIRVRLRSVCRKTWEFESPHAHQECSTMHSCAVSSVGRATRLHRVGRRSESCTAHLKPKEMACRFVWL